MIRRPHTRLITVPRLVAVTTSSTEDQISRGLRLATLVLVPETRDDLCDALAVTAPGELPGQLLVRELVAPLSVERDLV
jgi:hypothetical protein